MWYPTCRTLQVLVVMPPHLFWDLVVLILLVLLDIRLFWCVKVVFRFQVKTDTFSVHPPVTKEGMVCAHIKAMWELVLAGGRDERIVPILDHARLQSCREVM